MRDSLTDTSGMKSSVIDDALRSGFEPFLYATIDESNDEMPLSVLSALARLNLDPWEEAAVLARLPTAEAIARLTSPILAAVSNTAAAPDAASRAAHLIALLPYSTSNSRFKPASIDPPRSFPLLIIYLLIGVMMIASAVLNN